MELDRTDRRRMAFLEAVEKDGLESLKRSWDFNICPKEAAQKTLESAGYDFEKIWILNARMAHNPYTDKDELAIDWRTVSYYLHQKGLISSQNVIEGVEKAVEYCKSLG